MAGHWIVKTEPSTYSYDQLEGEKRTAWDGVSNAQALIHLRAMKAGDEVMIYHSGARKEIVGLAKVAKGPYPDPKEQNPKLVVVDLVPVRRLAHPVTLAEIKSSGRFADLGLVRQGRLSVMPVSPFHWTELLSMANS